MNLLYRISNAVILRIATWSHRRQERYLKRLRATAVMMCVEEDYLAQVDSLITQVVTLSIVYLSSMKEAHTLSLSISTLKDIDSLLQMKQDLTTLQNSNTDIIKKQKDLVLEVCTLLEKVPSLWGDTSK